MEGMAGRDNSGTFYSDFVNILLKYGLVVVPLVMICLSHPRRLHI